MDLLIASVSQNISQLKKEVEHHCIGKLKTHATFGFNIHLNDCLCDKVALIDCNWRTPDSHIQQVGHTPSQTSWNKRQFLCSSHWQGRTITTSFYNHRNLQTIAASTHLQCAVLFSYLFHFISVSLSCPWFLICSFSLMFVFFELSSISTSITSIRAVCRNADELHDWSSVRRNFNVVRVAAESHRHRNQHLDQLRYGCTCHTHPRLCAALQLLEKWRDSHWSVNAHIAQTDQAHGSRLST